MKFKSDIEVQAGLRDSSGAIGSSGQILSSTGTNVSWVNQSTIANDVQNQVKAGVAINKGQAVYVTGADGTNIIVGLASNASEATSSKTLGLLNATVAINGMADVVQIGRLSGLNTLGATAGDPVWLGTGGNLIYGLIGKPYAPANLVFIGIVTRVNVSNGEIFVNVQNGFELNEIHDVDLKTTVPVNGDILGFNGTLWVNKTIAGWLGYTPANASGTVNYVSKFTGATTLGNSQIFDNGSAVGINTNSPGFITAGRGVLSINGSSTSILEFQTGGSFKSYLYQSGSIFEMVDVNAIAFTTNNSERMRIISNGNVGIGTTAPYSRFTTYGALSTSTSQISIVNSEGGHAIIRSGIAGENNNGISLITASVDGSSQVTRMVINASGNVGIGTATPVVALDFGSVTGKSFHLYSASGDFYGMNMLQYDSQGFSTNIFSGNGGYIKFRTASGTSTQSTRMTIDPTGNVGIGNSSPSQKLHVTGNARITGGIYDSANAIGTSGQVLSSTGTGTSWVTPTTGTITGSGTTNYVTKFTGTSSIGNSLIYDNGTNVGINNTSPNYALDVIGSASISSNIYTNNVFGLSFGTVGYANSNTLINTYTGKDILFSVNNSEKMRVTSAGDVGIGTSSPISKLHTTGTATIGGGVFSSSGTMQLLTGGASPISNRITYSTDGTGWKFAIGKNQSGTVTDQFVIQDNGNVGIGTSSPVRKLDVAALSMFNGAQVRSTDDGSTLVGFFGNRSGWTGGSLDNNLSIGAYTSNICFFTNNSVSESMRITSAGNVGIGTTSPSQLLHVAGNARITGAVYDSSNSAGSSGQVLSSTATGTAWVTGGGGGGISGSGTTNTIPKFTGTTAIGNSNISDDGSLITTTTDVSVNGVTVGRGAGNISTNTVVGGAAFTANSSGSNNTAIGYAAGKYIDGSNNTFIGSDALKDPTGINFSGNNTLSIAKNSSGAAGYPHFWAPETITVADTTSENIIELDVVVYSGFFLDYTFQEDSANNLMQSGTIRAIFLQDGSSVAWSNDNVLSIGNTANVQVRAFANSTTARVQIDNNLGNSKSIYVNFTARLILRQTLTY